MEGAVTRGERCVWENFCRSSRPCCQRMGVSVSSCAEVSAAGVARTLRRHVEQNFEFARLGIFGGRGFLRSCSGSSKSKSNFSQKSDSKTKFSSSDFQQQDA